MSSTRAWFAALCGLNVGSLWLAYVAPQRLPDWVTFVVIVCAVFSGLMALSPPDK